MKSPTAQEIADLFGLTSAATLTRLQNAYAARIVQPRDAWRLALMHIRVWRALIDGDPEAFLSERGKLMTELGAEGLTLVDFADEDNQTLAELLEMVIARFQNSPMLLREFHGALMQISRQVGATRAA